MTIFGLHAVKAALRNPARRPYRLLATENALKHLAPLAADRGLTPVSARPQDLDRMLGRDTVHQGAVLEAAPLSEHGVEDFAEICRAYLAGDRPGPPPLFAALDQVTDPHNVGAILRSSAVFGVTGLVITHRHSPPLSGVLAKSASGGLELVPVARVTNLARALDILRDAGVDLLGLDAEGATRLEDERPLGPTAIVLGAEDRGLRRLTRDKCDRIVSISTMTALTSLNVSNAAAIAFHTMRQARRSES